ncbi:MAG TPA: ABC transporter permease [bacterium]|nr:ABC transporter permease [bacterium]HPN43913.1 ABC transporter permease [bacterium]
MHNRILPIIRKELIHILRDPRSLTIIFVLPTVMILLFGFAITFDIKDIKIAILDQDRSQASRQVAELFTNNQYFKIAADLTNRGQIEPLMMDRTIVAALVIPEGFGADLVAKPAASLQVLIDGSNANTATVVTNYITAALASYTMDLNSGLHAPVVVQPRIWYNPDLDSTKFIVPGLLAVLMMMICAMLTSITIAREKETGTMEQILVSPIRSYEIIIGKVLPYIVVAFVVASVVLAFAKIVFAVPIRGNLLLLAALSLVFIYASLSLGVLISSKARTQQVALMISLVGTLLPSILLSGFIFPLFALPKFLQALSYAVPARYYLVIVRGIMLKGIGFEYLYLPTLSLFLFGTLLLMISMKNFKTNLEG